MKLDAHFSFIRVCPETEQTLTDEQYTASNGICPHCGHESGTVLTTWPEKPVTHERKIAGKWNRPNLLEKAIGKKSKFISKKELRWI